MRKRHRSSDGARRGEPALYTVHSLESDVVRVAELLGEEPTSVRNHAKAVGVLHDMHQRLVADSSLRHTSRSRLALLDLCLKLLEQCHQSSSDSWERDAADLRATLHLTFALMCSNDEDRVAPNSWLLGIEWTSSPWADSLSTKGLVIASGSVRCSRAVLCSEAEAVDLERLCTCFMPCARDATLRSSLQKCKARKWIGLSEAERQDRIASLIGAAGAEMGQQAMKDVMLSFLLPKSTVGLRHTLLISRETNAEIAKSHVDLVHSVHSAAMATPAAVWADESFEPVARQSALLAGLAMFNIPNGGEVRCADAFDGNVQLPFLQFGRVREGPRVCLIDGQWWCYTAKNGGAPRAVHCCGDGIEGLVDCAAVLLTLQSANV